MSVRCVTTNIDGLDAPPAADGLDVIEQERRIFGSDTADIAEVS